MATSKSVIADQTKILCSQIGVWSRNDSQESRQNLQRAARYLANTLEAPSDIYDRMGFESILPVALAAAMEGNWLRLLTSGEPTMSASELAVRSGSQEEVVVRFMRVLSSRNIVDELGPREYGANETTRYFTHEVVQSSIQHLYPLYAQAILQLPSWLVRNRFQEPADLENGPFASRFQKTLWEALKDNPDANSAFIRSMDLYHVESVVEKGVIFLASLLRQGIQPDDQTVVLVDIGGGSGSFVERVRKFSPDLKGKLILQDRASVVKVVQLPESAGIEAMAYDFFTQQPLQDLRAYCLRHILHDWPDDDCRKILRNIIPALKPGFSSIYIFDLILPETSCGEASADLDIMLMAASSGKERTLAQWEQLLASIGLEIVRHAVVDEESREGVIEARIAENQQIRGGLYSQLKT